MGQKYIDSPNEVFTETVTLYEKGVKNVKKNVPPAQSNVTAGGIQYQGQGTETGVVSCHVFQAQALAFMGLVACGTLSTNVFHTNWWHS